MTTFPASPALPGADITFRPVQLRREAFLLPFYDDGIIAHRIRGARPDRINLDECREPPAALPLRAIIFHLSHCGSTLLGQLLSIRQDYRVVSEAEIINSVLLSHVFNNLDEEKTLTRLQKAAGLLLQPLSDNETGAFIKLTSWNIFHAGLILKAFPGVPLWYVHRDPTAVLSSLLRDPQGFASWNLHAAPLLAGHYLGLSKEEIRTLNQADFIGRMLLKHMQCALELPTGTLFLPYPDWIGSFFDTIGPIAGFSQKEIALVRERLRFDAKRQEVPFSGTGLTDIIPPLDKELADSISHANEAICGKWG